MATDPNEISDGHDSAYVGDDVSSTHTIDPGIFEYVYENGRRYHAACQRSLPLHAYPHPNDQQEQEILEAMHHLLLLLFQEKLYHAPLTEVHRILDLGTGTGHWAVEIADTHPEAYVLGQDISPIQPELCPSNCEFEVSDIEDQWNFRNQKATFIFGRCLSSSLRDAPRLCQQAYEHLSPGGWIEFQELGIPKSDDTTIPEDSELQRWTKAYANALRKTGCDPQLGEKYEAHLRATGFINVAVAKYKLPQNSWHDDEALKQVGFWFMQTLYDALGGLSLRLFTKSLNLPIEEVQAHLAEVRKDIADPKIHAYWPVYVVYGQKPRN